MQDPAEEIHIGSLYGLRCVEIVRLVADSACEVRRERWSGRDSFGEVLHDEGHVWVFFRQGNADKAVGAADVDESCGFGVKG